VLHTSYEEVRLDLSRGRNGSRPGYDACRRMSGFLRVIRRLPVFWPCGCAQGLRAQIEALIPPLRRYARALVRDSVAADDLV
jgi:hypothetical protein